MLEVYTDCSYADDILSVGFVVYDTTGVGSELVTTGTRVQNTKYSDRDIDWDANRGEYYALIVGVRSVLDQTHEPLCVYTDSQAVESAIANDGYTYEPYFQHALYSFIERFDDYSLEVIDRSDNQAAHQQARVGLNIGREIKQKSATSAGGC